MTVSKSVSKGGFGLNSLLAKCALSMGVVVLLVVAVVLWRAQEVKNDFASMALQDRAIEVTTLLAQQMGGSIKFGNQAAVKEVVIGVTELAGPDIIGILVVNSAMVPLFQTESEALQVDAVIALAQQAVDSGEVVKSADGKTVAVPSLFGTAEDVAGVIVSSWTADHKKVELKAAQQTTYIIGGSVFVISLGLVTVFLYFSMSRPLIRIEKAMRAVADEDYSSAIPFIKRGDEVGRIARSLDAFKSKLAQAQVSQVESAFKSSAFTGSSAKMMMVNKANEVTFLNPACEELLVGLSEPLQTLWPSAGTDKWIGAKLSDFTAMSDIINSVEEKGTDALPNSTFVDVGASKIRRSSY